MRALGTKDLEGSHRVPALFSGGLESMTRENFLTDLKRRTLLAGC
jgi:hypothetical protein